MERNKEYLKSLSNKELNKVLHESDYCDRDLLQEHDERISDGRIKLSTPIEPDQIEEFIRNKYAERRKSL